MRGTRIPAALCGLLLATASCGGLGAQEIAVTGSVQVALVSVFSGSDPSLGTYLENSAEVEIDQINASGGLLGRRVTLVSADDELQAPKAVELVREHLVDDGVKLVIGPSSQAAFSASRAEIDQAGIPNCLPTPVADQAVSGASSTFRTREGTATLYSAVLGYIRKHTQLKNVGLITQGGPEDQVVSSLARSFGLTDVGAVVGGANADEHSQVQQLAGRGAQALLLPDDAIAAASIVQAIDDLGLTGHLQAFGPADLATSAFTQAAGSAAAGTIVVAPDRDYLAGRPASSWPAGYRTFVNRIIARYGYSADGIEIKGLPEGADCVVLWAQAVQRAGTFDGRAVVRAWENLHVAGNDSALGVPEAFSPSDHDGVSPQGLFVYQWVTRGQQLRLQRLAGQ